VLAMIRKNESGWEEFVPRRVSDIIKRKHMFDFPVEMVEEDEEDLINT
jgi:hypothetical protein